MSLGLSTLIGHSYWTLVPYDLAIFRERVGMLISQQGREGHQAAGRQQIVLGLSGAAMGLRSNSQVPKRDGTVQSV